MSTHLFHQPGHGGTHAGFSSVARKYLEEQLNTMSPIQLLVKVYDMAIDACKRGERRRASKALIELINALNFDHEEMANRFLFIYEFCLARVRSGDYDSARETLEEIRNAWVEAANMKPSAETEAPSSPTIQAQA